MKALNAIVLINDVAGRWAMYVSCGLLVYIAGHISLEIILRSFFARSTYSMDEFVGYAVGAMTFLSLAYTFRQGKHIRVSILTGAIRGKLAKGVDLTCLVFTFGITLFLARFIWRTLERDFSRGTVSPSLMETPIWWIDAAIFTGLVLFLFQLLTSMLQILMPGAAAEEREATD